MSDSENKKTIAEINEIQKELNATTNDVKASKLMSELIDVAHRGGRVTEFEIEHYIEEYLWLHVPQYPSLMDVCDGNDKKIIALVREYMLTEAAWGREHTISAAFGQIETLAARFVMGLPASDSAILRLR